MTGWLLAYSNRCWILVVEQTLLRMFFIMSTRWLFVKMKKTGWPFLVVIMTDWWWLKYGAMMWYKFDWIVWLTVFWLSSPRFEASVVPTHLGVSKPWGCPVSPCRPLPRQRQSILGGTSRTEKGTDELNYKCPEKGHPKKTTVLNTDHLNKILMIMDFSCLLLFGCWFKIYLGTGSNWNRSRFGQS